MADRFTKTGQAPSPLPRAINRFPFEFNGQVQDGGGTKFVVVLAAANIQTGKSYLVDVRFVATQNITGDDWRVRSAREKKVLSWDGADWAEAPVSGGVLEALETSAFTGWSGVTPSETAAPQIHISVGPPAAKGNPIYVWVEGEIVEIDGSFPLLP